MSLVQVSTAKCIHFPQCGGCSCQNSEYLEQLAFKQEQLKNQFASFFENDPLEYAPIIPCENPWQYRNKMEFSFSQDKKGNKFLGLMLKGGRGRVLDLQECHLVPEWFMNTLKQVRAWWEESPLQAYFHRRDEGHLRTLTLRQSQQGTGCMVMLTVSGNPTFAIPGKWLDQLVACLGEDPHLSVFLQIQQIAKGSPTQFFEMLLAGPDHITETLYVEVGGKKHVMNFKISPTSFFQPNTLQAQKLYSKALQLLPNLSESLVFDLYCGGATIGLSCAKVAKEVVGIESNPYSVFDAGWNQEVNKVDNFSIHRGDVGTVLQTLEKRPDSVILDPPRSGLDAKALEQVIALKPTYILYISCNPKTQAENCQIFSQNGYQLKFLQGVDQFPHTPHLESIALLQLER